MVHSINTGLPFGGACVNVGCVASKALLWAGEVLHLATHHGVPGIDLAVMQFDFRTPQPAACDRH